MRIVLLMFVLYGTVISGCESGTDVQSASNEPLLVLNEVEQSLENAGVEIEKVKADSSNSFQQEINNVTPAVYKVGEGILSVYVYSSLIESSEAEEEYEAQLGTANWDSISAVTEAENVLVFLQNGNESNTEFVMEAIEDLKGK